MASPLSITELRRGPTRVQLECRAGVPGRIHAIELRPGENSVSIDPDFDAVMHTQGGLWAQYSMAAERTSRARQDIVQVGRALRGPRVIELGVDGTVYPLSVRAFLGNAEVATLNVTAGGTYDAQQVAGLVRAILRATQPTAAAADVSPQQALTPANSEPSAAQASPLAGPRHEQKLVLGLALGAAGLGGLAVSWVLYLQRHAVRNSWDAQPDFAYRKPAVLILSLGGAGAALIGLSDYFWLPDSPEVPIAAWIAGGLGGAVALVGLGFGVLGTHCGQRQGNTVAPGCQLPTSDVIFAPLFALHALPLLAVPLSYAMRSWTRPSGVILSVHGGPYPSGPGLWIDGRF